MGRMSWKVMINVNHQGISITFGKRQMSWYQNRRPTLCSAAGEERYGHNANKLLKMESNVTKVMTFDSHKWTFSIFNVYLVHTLLLMADCAGENWLLALGVNIVCNGLVGMFLWLLKCGVIFSFSQDLLLKIFFFVQTFAS